MEAFEQKSDKPRREPIWVPPIGLTLLFEPKDLSCVVADVVFVHGLQGRPWKTWRYQGKKVVERKLVAEPPKKGLAFLRRSRSKWDKIEKDITIFWPRDLLPDDVADIRIFTYGYDSDVSHYIAGPANKSNISQHGLTLLNCILTSRLACPERPIIFVAHSLGGLLVKQALIESSKQALDGRDHSIHRACRGVIFLVLLTEALQMLLGE